MGEGVKDISAMLYQSLEKHKYPRNQDTRKVWESEEGFPKQSRGMSGIKTNGASLNKSINGNDNW